MRSVYLYSQSVLVGYVSFSIALDKAAIGAIKLYSISKTE